MIYENAHYADRDNMIRLLKGSYKGPVCMVNLLKFRERAEYPDGRDADLPGREAYLRYGQAFMKIARPHGVTSIYNAPIQGLIVGEVEGLWDTIALVKYPSLSVFTTIVGSDEVAALQDHRKAGIAGQLLIMTGENGGGLG